MDDNQCKTSKKLLCFQQTTCSVHSCPWPQSQILQRCQNHVILLMDEPHTSHFPNFPFTCKAPSRVHGKVPPRRHAACHICSRLLAESVHKDTKLYSSRNRALSFSKSNCQRAHTPANPNCNTPAKLIAWNQTQTTWGTHTNRSRRSSLSCDPLRPAITLQIRSYSRGIVLCQRTPSPSIPPIPAAPCNNKPPCSHVTGLECLTGGAVL